MMISIEEGEVVFTPKYQFSANQIKLLFKFFKEYNSLRYKAKIISPQEAGICSHYLIS
jgi:hypothetical protein